MHSPLATQIRFDPAVPQTQEAAMKLALDQLKVTSFETAAPVAAALLPASGGEDCFSYMAGCIPTITRTAAA
jgi:hypothetical protein